MHVINLWGGPGSGKTTTAAGLFSILRHRWTCNLELVTEFATDVCFEQARENLKDQMYLLGNQYHRLWRAQQVGVECVITDAPIGLNRVYGALYKQRYMKEMGPMITALESAHTNQHLLMVRDPDARGGFKGGKKSSDTWFVEKFDNLIDLHGPAFEKRIPYTPVATEQLATYLCDLHKSWCK